MEDLFRKAGGREDRKAGGLRWGRAKSIPEREEGKGKRHAGSGALIDNDMDIRKRGFLRLGGQVEKEKEWSEGKKRWGPRLTIGIRKKVGYLKFKRGKEEKTTKKLRKKRDFLRVAVITRLHVLASGEGSGR